MAAVHLRLGLGGPWGSGCDLTWHQLAQLGAGQLFQTYVWSHSHLRSGRWGQSLVRYSRAFQFQGSPLIEHNTQVRMALHPEGVCNEVCVNTLPPADCSWNGRRLGSCSLWASLEMWATRVPHPGPPTMPRWWSRYWVSSLRDVILVCRVYK